MKKRMIILGMIMVMSMSFTACKSTDYKDAVELETNKDYAGAMTIFETLVDYKDANAHASFDKAADEVAKKNAELDKEISDAETVISEGKTALDETLFPSLETAISNAKADKKEIPVLTDETTDIDAIVKELEAVDYSNTISQLTESKNALTTSIAQYDQVNNPTETFVIKCLGTVEHIVDISAVTEDNDPNGKLNKAGGYTTQVYFSSDLIDQNSVSGVTVIDKGTDCGGSIEVYSTPEDAVKREEYLSGFDGSIFASGSHTVVGTCLVRTSDKLTCSQQKELEAGIVAALTKVE